MVGDVLSQAEVESLLTAMEGGPKKLPDLPESSLPDLAPLARPREKVTPYDFKRPERVGKEQMRALQTLHEGFGRNFGAALSGLLRSIVEVKLTSVDQLTYSEFVFSLENPTCFNLLRAEPLEGNLILDINPSILYPIIDRLLGGGRDPGPIARRPLTEIELRLVSANHESVPRAIAARVGKCRRAEAFGRAGRKQSAVGADRAAQRSRRADQLRADARRHSRDDELLHSVQFDRADRQQALVEQLDQLRPAERHARITAAASAATSRARSSNWSPNWRKPESAPAT